MIIIGGGGDKEADCPSGKKGFMEMGTAEVEDASCE